MVQIGRAIKYALRLSNKKPRSRKYHQKHDKQLENIASKSSDNIAVDYVILSGIPYDDIGGGQRSAQLTRAALCRGKRVLYAYTNKKYNFELQTHEDSNVNIDKLIHVDINNVSDDSILEYVKASTIVICELPHKKYLGLIKKLKLRNIPIVFELIDNWKTSLGLGWYDELTYQQYLTYSTIVNGTARKLTERLVTDGRSDAFYLPNAADEKVFSKYKKYNKPHDLPDNQHKNALYFGSLFGDWFDWDALKAAARRNSDVNFLLIGNAGLRASYEPNIFFLGEKENYQLPAYLYYSDFALLPFKTGEICDYVSPIKIFEYIFFNKPVVSTVLPEIVDYPGVLLSKDSAEFAENCHKACSVKLDVGKNDAFISAHSWNGRLDSLNKAINKKPVQKIFSAIILIHNNANIIERCLKSLLDHGRDYLKDIIVVDNASTDGGAEIVRKLFPEVTLIENPKNGCSLGRNLGARAASGDVLAFFDSDQWFVSGAFFEEAQHILDNHADVGAVGWTGGWFGDFHRDLSGPIVEDFPNRGMGDRSKYIEYRTDLEYLGTGGLFIPSSIFNALSGFDEAYDPTCFEDTDISFQIRHLGFKLAYRDLTGIMHQPHQTTKADHGSPAYRKLFRRNEKYFRKKWKSFYDLISEKRVD